LQLLSASPDPGADYFPVATKKTKTFSIFQGDIPYKQKQRLCYTTTTLAGSLPIHQEDDEVFRMLPTYFFDF